MRHNSYTNMNVYQGAKVPNEIWNASITHPKLSNIEMMKLFEH